MGLLFNISPKCFDLSTFGFVIEAFFLGAAGWFGRFALFWGNGDALNQCLEAVEGIVSILLLGAVLLSLDDNDAVFGDAVVVEVEQAFFVKGGEG